MAWIIGIGIFLFLLFCFPKQMFGLIALLVLVAGGVWAYFTLQEMSQKSSLKDIQTSISATCTDADHPLYVSFTNGTGKTVNSLSFTVEGYKHGYSNTVEHDWFSSDKIIAPNESYAACWRLSSYGRAIEYKDLDWRIKLTGIKFE